MEPTLLRRRRLAAQLLARRGASEPGAVTRHLLAVQAQDLRAARLALRARAAGFAAGAVDAALSRPGELVVAWLLRGTLHLVAPEDHGWLLALTAPGREVASRRRLGQEGVRWEEAERAVGLVERALGHEGPLTRVELGVRLARAGIPTAGQALPHLLGLAATRGVAVLGPVREGSQAFVLAREWLPRGDGGPRDRDAALVELARRYLAAHGPAREEDLARWSGLPLRDARAGLRGMAGGVEPLGDGFVDLAGRSAGAEAGEDAPPDGVALRLLPAFDPYLLGWRDRGFAVDPADARRVHPGGGMLRAVVVVDGRAVATWSARRANGRLAVTVAALRALGAREREALDAERADVARFEGLPLAD